MLTQARLKAVLKYDSATGIFTWKKSIGRSVAGKNAGALQESKPGFFRIVISVDRTSYKAHRLAWFYCHGKWPSKTIDHIDGNPLNNAIGNLRDVDQFVNQQNRTRHNKNNKLNLIGVYERKKKGVLKKYIAKAMHRGRVVNLGSYYSPNEAREAYLNYRAGL